MSTIKPCLGTGHWTAGNERERGYRRERIRSPRSRSVTALTALLLHQHHNRSRTDDVLGPEHLLLLPRLTDVVRRILTGVDDPVPGLVEAVDDRENQRIGESVNHDVHILIAPARAFQVISDALCVLRKISGSAYASPTDIIAPEPP